MHKIATTTRSIAEEVFTATAEVGAEKRAPSKTSQKVSDGNLIETSMPSTKGKGADNTVQPSFEAHETLGAGLGLLPDYVIEGFLEVGEQLLLYGQPKVGKTFLAIQLALEVAKGGSFLKWNVPKPRKVLYVNFEMGLRIFVQRVISHLEPMRGKKTVEQQAAYFDQQLDGKLVFTTRPRSLDILGSKKNQPSLHDLIKQHRPELVIIDTLAKTHSVDERANEKIGAVLTAIRKACEIDNNAVAHVIVHHARKAAVGMDDSPGYVSASEIRGGSAIRGEADVIAGLYVRAGGRGGGNMKFLSLEARNANLEDIEVEFNEDLLFRVAEIQSGDKALDVFKRKLLAAVGPVSKPDLMSEVCIELGLEIDTVRRAVSGWLKSAIKGRIITDKPQFLEGQKVDKRRALIQVLDAKGIKIVEA